MKVLLLGKNGMLGREIYRLYNRDDIIGLDTPDIDLEQPKTITDRIEEERPDVVINAAAYTDVDGCETDVDRALQVNGMAVGEIALTTKRAGGIFVHFSTDYVFDGEKEEGYKEQDRPTPLSVYGKSKLLGEEHCQQETDAHYIIRTSSMYGLTGTHFVRSIVEAARAEKKLEVVTDQIAKPSYARDVAEETKRLLSGGAEFGIYHVTNEPATSWYDFAVAILKAAHIKAKVGKTRFADLKRPAPRPQYSVLLNTKLQPLRSWSETLPEVLESLNA